VEVVEGLFAIAHDINFIRQPVFSKRKERQFDVVSVVIHQQYSL
jgi:hypothetical protein